MRIALIGGGKMGEAIIAAVLEKLVVAPADIRISDINEARRDYLARKYHVWSGQDNRESLTGSDIVIIAVKPQELPPVMDGLKGRLQAGQVLLSIVAGVRIKALQEGFAHEAVVRAMPNTPAQIGVGITGWAAAPAVTSPQRQRVRMILAAMGREIMFADEEFLDMVTAISGSGPAYFFLFAESLIDAGVNIGLSPADARELVTQTMLGAAQLLQKSGRSPGELRRDVTSKGGTTERAIKVFEESGLANMVLNAVRAAYERSKEMGG